MGTLYDINIQYIKFVILQTRNVFFNSTLRKHVPGEQKNVQTKIDKFLKGQKR